MQNKKAIVLVNVGTPDSPEVKDVRRYLFEFLNDKRVIDLPFLLRKFLVNVIIVPFRAPKSAKLYQQLWTDKGSPIIYYTENLRQKMQEKVGDTADVYMAMRYQNPSMPKVWKEIAAKNYSEVQVVPMYPHYAESTTGTTIAYAQKLASKYKNFPPMTFVEQFYTHPSYLDAFEKVASRFNHSDYDKILFSYHGLPMRQVQKNHPNNPCANCNCIATLPEYGQKCYRGTCYATTRLLVEKLGIPKEKTYTSFQSRLSNNWMEPFSDKVIEDWAKEGIKKILVFAPAFVTDCLETIIEIGDEYLEIFKENGGQQLDMVPALNDEDVWAEALLNICKA